MRSVSTLAQAQNAASWPAIQLLTSSGSSLCPRRQPAFSHVHMLRQLARLTSRSHVPGNRRQPSLQTGISRYSSDFKKPNPAPASSRLHDATNPASGLDSSSGVLSDVSNLDNLPSKVASRRSAALKRVQPYMDHLLSRIAIATHAVNTYTGTDFSPISQLREAIIQQEHHVDSVHLAVTAAKATHDRALTSQQASQKEVVQLLERKHSWSPEDLERYMALIRSEHENEQRVQTAKEGVRAAERDLEDARAKLEGFERRQYHEEQVWSDTIRRNSTWVTFGLMGLNVVLLLASLVVIEPWRRKRLVREIKGVLADEKAGSIKLGGATVAQVDHTAPVPENLPEGSQAPRASSSVSGYMNTDPVWEGDKRAAPLLENALPPDSAWAGWTAYWHDLFSDRQVALRRIDLTKATLEGAAAGAASMGLLLVLLRPR